MVLIPISPGSRPSRMRSRNQCGFRFLLRKLCTLLLLGAMVAPSWAQPTEQVGAMVRFHGTDLFLVQARVGSFTPAARAAAIGQRLEQLERDPFAPLPDFKVTEDGLSTVVMAGDLILFAVTEEDARLAEVDRALLAQQRADLTQRAFRAESLSSRLRKMGRTLLLVFVVTVLATFVFWAARRILDRARQGVEKGLDRRVGRLQVQGLELLSAEQARRGLLRAFGVLKGLLYLLLAYAYLSAMFGLFPTTRGLASRLLDLALTPIVSLGRAMVAYVPNLFFLLVIALITRLFLKGLRLLFEGIQSEKLSFASFHAEWADPTHKLVRILVFGFALVLAFPYLPGSGSEAFKGVSLFLGVLFSLGSSGAVTNLVGGVLLTYMRPFRVGDRVQIGDTVGDVVERTALVTRLITIKNVEVTIPNGQVLSGPVQNFSAKAKESGLILHTTVTIGYDAPWRTVHRLLTEAAAATEGLLSAPEPFVLQTCLDDFYVSYQINAYTDQPQRMARIYATLHANIQDRFNAEGVEIMSPHYRALRDGNVMAVPSESLPSGYRAPGFRVQGPSEEALG